jgi:hypothetical protein
MEMFILAKVDRLVVVFDDRVFPVIPYFTEKVMTRLDMAQLVERAASRRIGRFMRFLVDMNADLMLGLVMFH